MTSQAKPEVFGFFDDATYTISYVVSDPATGRAAIIDPVLDFDPKSGRTSKDSADHIIAYVTKKGLKIDLIMETHVHADHMSAAPYLKEKLGGKIVIGNHVTTVQSTFGKLFNVEPEFAADGSQFDTLLADGDTFRIGSLEGYAMHTPGHTPACMSYVVGDAVFVGDTLFMPDYGTARCDFPGGDAAVLYKSVRRLLELPDHTRMFLCHDYLPAGRSHYIWETTVGEQRRSNIHIREGVSEQEFVSLRRGRDAKLAMPVLILPSVQVNMRAGHMPPPEDNGVSYLKLPVDML